MIRPLRTTHRWVFILLAIALPAVLGTALWYRAPRPEAASVFPRNASTGTVRAENVTSGIGIAYMGKLLRARLGQVDGTPFLTVEKTIGVPDPDLQLYWSALRPPPDSPLPDDVVRIGAITEAETDVFRVPDGAVPNTGYFLLFSLANRKTIASATFSFR